GASGGARKSPSLPETAGSIHESAQTNSRKRSPANGRERRAREDCPRQARTGAKQSAAWRLSSRAPASVLRLYYVTDKIAPEQPNLVELLAVPEYLNARMDCRDLLGRAGCIGGCPSGLN